MKNTLPTLETLRENQESLRKKFGSTETIGYPNISNSQLSIARYYGGCKVNNQDYTYNPADDSLIRADIIKFLNKLNKKKLKKKLDQQPELV
jgi:hypothetical protein